MTRKGAKRGRREDIKEWIRIERRRSQRLVARH